VLLVGPPASLVVVSPDAVISPTCSVGSLIDTINPSFETGMRQGEDVRGRQRPLHPGTAGDPQRHGQVKERLD
jgi:hypothetical protein